MKALALEPSRKKLLRRTELTLSDITSIYADSDLDLGYDRHRDIRTTDTNVNFNLPPLTVASWASSSGVRGIG